MGEEGIILLGILGAALRAVFLAAVQIHGRRSRGASAGKGELMGGRGCLFTAGWTSTLEYFVLGPMC